MDSRRQAGKLWNPGHRRRCNEQGRQRAIPTSQRKGREKLAFRASWARLHAAALHMSFGAIRRELIADKAFEAVVVERLGHGSQMLSGSASPPFNFQDEAALGPAR